MTTYYRTLEIADAAGKPTGKYRKVEHNSSMTRCYGLCDHEHDTVEEADACPDIQEEMARVFPERPTCPKCTKPVSGECLYCKGFNEGLQETANTVMEGMERIATLEHYIEAHLSALGACGDEYPESDETLCSDPSCTYCEMARALQPTICGLPLTPRR